MKADNSEEREYGVWSVFARGFLACNQPTKLTFALDLGYAGGAECHQTTVDLALQEDARWKPSCSLMQVPMG